MQPRITVIIANKNYGKWVVEAINSALNSEWKNLIIGVVDDCSTDDSVSRINAATKDMQRVWFHRGEDRSKGPSWARNQIIKKFIDHTDYFIPLDADDKFYRNRISRLIKEFAHPAIGGVYSDYHLEYEDGTVVTEYKKPFSLEELKRECLPHSSSMVSAEALRFAGLYDESLRVWEDYDLWMRIAQKYLFVHVPETTMLVRTGGHNSTSTVARATWNENAQKVADKWNLK